LPLGKLNGQKAFQIRKRIIRIIAGTKTGASCKELLKKFNILPLATKFFALINMICSGQYENFQTDSDIHSISTGYRYNLHVLNTDLSKYQKGVYSTGIKLFNNLPPIIEGLNHNKRMLTPALKEYVLSHSYSVGEFTFTKNSELS
jgi:hypothetical protein